MGTRLHMKMDLNHGLIRELTHRLRMFMIAEWISPVWVRWCTGIKGTLEWSPVAGMPP